MSIVKFDLESNTVTGYNRDGSATFVKVFEVAQEKYPYEINYFEEYQDYYVFGYDDGNLYIGGPTSPIVIRKSDFKALNYDPWLFLGLDPDAENAGDILDEGEVI